MNPHNTWKRANRLVADTLETDWNEHLRRLDTLQQDHDQQRKADEGLLSEEARTRILALSADFPRVWNNPRTPPLERKRMVALLIEDVTLIKAETIAVHVRYRGGRTTSLNVERPKPMALVRKTLTEVIHKLDQLLDTCSDREAAAQLNALGYRNWKGEPFTSNRISYVRRMYGLKSRFGRLRDRGAGEMQALARSGKAASFHCRHEHLDAAQQFSHGLSPQGNRSREKRSSLAH
jgi:hypothetical protein